MTEHMSGVGLVEREGGAGAEGEKKVERRKAKKKKQGGRGQQQQGEKEDGAMVRTQLKRGEWSSGRLVLPLVLVLPWRCFEGLTRLTGGDVLSFCLCQGVAEAGEGAGAHPAPSPASGYSTALLHDAIIAGQVVLHHASEQRGPGTTLRLGPFIRTACLLEAHSRVAWGHAGPARGDSCAA